MDKGAVLILGAGSDIGIAVAEAFAQRGYAIQLAARKPDMLEAARAGLATKHGLPVTSHAFDALFGPFTTEAKTADRGLCRWSDGGAVRQRDGQPGRGACHA